MSFQKDAVDIKSHNYRATGLKPGQHCTNPDDQLIRTENPGSDLD